VTYAVDGAVATITMRTPALGLAAKQMLLAAATAAAGDDAIRAVLLTGSGRVFTAGQDLGEHAGALREAGPEAGAGAGTGAFDTIGAHYNPLVTTLATMPKPVVAAVNGTCAGAGLGIALACDLRIAAMGARFTTAFTGIGLTPDSGLSASLSRAVGTARASELIMLAAPFTAEDALSWGLVGQVVPAGELAAAAGELAARLAAGPTQAYAVAKRAIRQAWTSSWPEVLAVEERDQAALGATADHRGAVDAFLAKRRPEFTGHE
jgi:2-(1,2-epoxy-1,2-dihydrophenyl)acetyl-CoA isomerase